MVWKLFQLALLPAVLLALALLVPPQGSGKARRGLGPEPSFFAGASPTEPIELGATPGAVDSSGGWFRVAVLAELPDATAAARVAETITGLLRASARHYERQPAARAALLDEESAAPLTPAELELFQRHGVTSQIGVGWSSEGDPRVAVTRLGRLLVVSPLKGDFASRRPNPLGALLERLGGRVFVEGDPAGGRRPLVDLTCTAPDEARATELAAALDSYLELPVALHARPPWHPQGLSADQSRARATFAALTRAVRRGLEGIDVQELFIRQLSRARNEEDAQALAGAVQREIAATALAALDAAAGEPGRDPVVVDELRRAITTSEDRGPRGIQAGILDPGRWRLEDPQALRRLAPRLGSLELALPEGGGQLEPRPEEQALGAAGRARRDGVRLELGGVAFQRLARGLPALLAWLRAAGCREARLGLAESGRE